MYDISELEDEGEFSLDGADVMAIFAAGPEPSYEEEWFPTGAIRDYRQAFEDANGVEVYAMDATDDDGEWCCAPGLAELWPARVRAVQAHRAEELDVVVDSGADVSVAPLRFGRFGTAAQPAEVVMQDAQGHRIVQHGSRVLDLDVGTLEGGKVTTREKFAIAKVGAVIVSLGRLMRQGWCLGSGGSGPYIEQHGNRIPVRLRRKILTMMAVVSAITAVTTTTEGARLPDPPQVLALPTFDDVGPLPPVLAELADKPGWHILGNGLPILVANAVEELDLEKLIWSEEDWPYLAAFVKADEAKGKPKPARADTWIQLLTLTSEAYGSTPRKITDLDAELTGRRDVIVLFHVEELPRNLLTEPAGIFDAGEQENMDPYLPEGEDNGGGAGVGEDAEEVIAEGEPIGEEPHGDDELEGVRVHVSTPLRTLKELCDKLGLSHSGGKSKVLKRLKEHHEVLSRQLSAEIAKKMYMDNERPPDMPKIPILPSTRQQELHNITHHPFQSWCEACVVGRSKQSPHKSAEVNKGQEVAAQGRATPTLQIDYAYTFTKQKHEVQQGEGRSEGQQANGDREPGAEPGPKPDDDYENQHGLCLVGAESTTGWTVAIPIAQKGSSSLKSVSPSTWFV